MYDVIVVGAGNGGLAAAVRLAKAGKQVLLIEQHNLPGGVATSFVRGRFEFECSLHELCNIGSKENPASARVMYESLGVDIDWNPIPDVFRAIGKYSDGSDMDVTMPMGERAFIDKMEFYVPDSRAAMEKLFRLFSEVQCAIEHNLDHGTRPIYILRHYPNFIKYSAYSALEVMKAISLPQRAIDIMTTYWSYLGAPMSELSFMHYTLMVYPYIIHGAYIPYYTSHELTLSLSESFIKEGGKILYNTKVTQILFEKKRACGVKTDSGEFFAKAVVFGGNPSRAVAELIPEKITRKRTKQRVNARTFSSMPFVVYLGLNKSAEELGIKDYSFFLPSKATSEEEYLSMKGIDTNDYLIAVCPNVVDKEASQRGTAILTLTTIFSSECWNDIQVEDYNTVKWNFAEKMIKNFEEKTGIKISDSIEEIDAATPWTIHRYAFTPSGAAFGYELKKWDNILARFLCGREQREIKGLYFCGGACELGNGYNVSATSGNIAANGILKKSGGKK